MLKHRNYIAWMVISLLAVAPQGCEKDEAPPIVQTVSTAMLEETIVGPDLEEIKARGKLVALTLNSSTSYFIYRGHAMGFEYELLQRFAKSIGVELEMQLIPDVNTMFDMLNKGEGDMIACNLAITSDRQRKAAFSEPYNFTKLVLIQRLPEDHQNMTQREINKNLLLRPLDLSGKTIYVNHTSPSYERLINLQKESGISFEIIKAPGYIDPEKLIQKVADGEIDYTVADDNLANLNSTYYNNIDVSVQLSFPRQIGWALRKNNPQLLAAVNAWFEKDRLNSVHAYIYKKYFKAPKEKWEEYNGEFSSLNGNRICNYDELLREYCDIIDWDWRLLAAQMYQESKFQEDARSWAGAFGLMQFMPATGKMYGVDTSSGPREHIRGAILHLSRLESFWQERILDPENRIHFTLASYNAGLGHVIDAVSLAEDLGYDPMIWENNVAECIKLKSQKEYYTSDVVKYGYCRGEEPVTYVKKIINQYRHYSRVIDQS
ncbi:MAG: membrane-bound lytic murein transglycosylase F [Flammeovirgaceae bacterium]|jgi:membrane-bound lytic murein transglycosylase F